MRRPRLAPGGLCYHVCNRGNRKAEIFHDPIDYRRFIHLMDEACARLPVSVFSFCLMPNHVHLVVRPEQEDDLSMWMQWLLTTQVRQHHARYGTSGHLWQDRYRSFPIEQDDHLLTVLRYAERNPQSAGLVRRAEQWSWSALHYRLHDLPQSFLRPWPVRVPDNWIKIVNEPFPADEARRIRRCIAKGVPYGNEDWCRETARLVGASESRKPADHELIACA